MKRGILLMVLALLSLAAAKVPVYDPHRDGAYSALDIRAVDDMGMPVPGADLCVSFAIGPVESIDRTGSTDGEGCFSASCDTTGSIWIRVLKDGYYRTRLHVDAQHVPYETARETRKWSDGSVTIPVVLKKIRNPTKLSINGGEMRWPATNTVLGFDLELFDWCPPFGGGKHDDLQLEYDFWRSPTEWDHFYSHLTMTMTNCVDGLYLAPVDAFSLLKRCYSANPDADYQRRFEFVYDRRSGEVTQDIPMPQDQYMVFRTRTQTNELGEVISAHYGLLLEEGEFGGSIIRLRANFNPHTNDTNLECTEERHGW